MKYHLNAVVIVLAAWSVSTILLFTSYGLVQQAYRQNANDPQLQLSQDGATAIANGEPADTIIGDTEVDLRTSLAPAVIIYGEDKQVVVANAKLDGGVPTVPSGVLEYAKLHGRDMVTWAPASGVRLAAVVVRSGGESPGYVVAVRSLKEVEVRESAALNLTALTWVLVTLVIFGTWALLVFSRKRVAKRQPKA